MRLDQKPTYNFFSSNGSEPDPSPQPTPFPIRIVQDPAPPGDPVTELPATKTRSDHFYPAWDKFLAVQPTRAKLTTKAAKQLKKEKAVVEESQPDGLHFRENAAKSWEEASAECKAKVVAIVEECKRLNQKYKDAIFDLESNPYCLQSLTGQVPAAVADIEEPPWVKRVEDIYDDPQFYVDGASATDIHQGNAGDCWFLAALMAVSAKKELIDNLCVARDEKAGVYGFVFYRDGEWIYEVIDDKLYLRVGDDDKLSIVRNWRRSKKEGTSLRHDEDKLKEQLQKGGEALYFSHCKSNETWLPLIEKAYAKAHGDCAAIEGGFASEGIEDLTGGVATVINPEDIMDKERFWKEQLSQVNDKYLFGGGSRRVSAKGVVAGHAYTVLQAWEEGDLKLLKLRNPWGEVEWEGDWSDGSKLWTPDMMRKLNHTFGDDGIFWISYKDFFKQFPSVNRVRLFDKDWQVAQQWSCVSIPWTVDYLDTRFELTVAEKSPIVIVLSQPDDRYFYGMRGRYLYALHFRLYRQNESGHKYLMRSLHNSGNETEFTRSVSAELEDLEPGKYYIIFKVTATRTAQMNAEEVVLKYAADRKAKLLQVGRRYDYAHTKGNLRAMEKAVRKQQRTETWEKATQVMRRTRRLNQQERVRVNKRKKRINDATNEKRKAIHEQLVEKRKQDKEKERAKAKVKSGQAENVTPDPAESPANEATFENTVEENSVEGGMQPPESIEAGEKEPKSVQAVQTTKQEDEPSIKTATPASKEIKQDSSVTETPAASKPAEESHSSVNAKPAGDSPGLVEAKSEEESKGSLDIKPAGQSKGSEDAKLGGEPKSSVDTNAVTVAGIEINTGASKTEPTEKLPTEPVVDDNPEQPKNLEGDKAKSEADEDDEDDAWEEPADSVDELDDNDFDWDSDVDGPINSDTSSQTSGAGNDIDIFGDDPWTALCVLGLRIYSKCEVKILVRTTDDEQENVEEEV